MKNRINLTEMTEQERSEKSAELRKEAQQLLNSANMVDSVKSPSADERRIIEQIKDIGIGETAKIEANDIPTILDSQLTLPKTGNINLQPMPIVPIENDPSDCNIVGIDNGRGEQRITPLFNDRYTGGFVNHKQRDCSKCAKWGVNHCLVRMPAPRQHNGSCEHYMELQELKRPRFLVEVYCPICHNFLSKIDISEPIKCARCFRCNTDIAGIWLNKNSIIKDTENGEIDSNRKIQEIHSESSKADGIN